MSETERDSLLLVGVCGPPHGIRGEVKVIPETDDPERLLGLERVWVGTSLEEARPREIVGARFHTSKRGLVVLMQFRGADTPEAAEALRKHRVYAHEDDLPALDEGDLYLHDLVGMAVLLEENGAEPIGEVAEVIEGVAQDLLVVRRPGQPDALVPDVPEIVVAVDPEAGTLTLRPPEGLLD
jgi:16S rRNA processing protein RimM